ncbi:ABC transporter family substrate-binding protein [Cryobacterium sp. Y62]|uniref:ABC transporter family substrate-binding protein n=1 Tax=Cryobacterium sp. Y62 TaxID=2048284 RepID=UPI001E2A5898|nr:ABC transporter family substrate-binding protein [Cryobacterium sp. Y62]
MFISTPHVKRLAVAGAIAGVASLFLAGCTTTDDLETPAESGGTVRIAEVNELSSFNTGTADGNVDINNQLDYFTQGDFFHLDDTASLVYDEGFGTVELLSEDPLSVKYTVNDDVVWSDGESIDADDMLLGWAAQSGYFDDADAEATIGTTYFSPAGSTTGLDQMAFPEVGDDGKSITVTYSGPYADWTLFSPMSVPAHVLAEQAGFEPDGMIAILEAATEGNVDAPVETNADLRAVADFWNNGYATSSLPSDSSLYLSSGPFVVSSWDPAQSVTLSVNDTYTGDLAPVGIDQIVVRFIADANAQVQALQNGEVDIINPQASADTLSSLEALTGVKVLTGDTGSYDHVDLNFAAGGVFADANVREAFLKTIPREQILDAIIRPLDPEAELLNSQIFFPGVNGYDEATSTNGSDAYDTVDISGATALLAGATPTVRLAYSNANTNRVDAFLAIQASAAEAGFIVVDGGLPADQWGDALALPETWDAFIFGWSTVGAGVLGVPQLFDSASDSNFGGFSDPAADALMDQLLATTDAETQVELQVGVEKALWAGGFGLPMYILPGVIAFGPNVDGIEYSPWQTGPIWNFWDWTMAA